MKAGTIAVINVSLKLLAEVEQGNKCGLTRMETGVDGRTGVVNDGLVTGGGGSG